MEVEEESESTDISDESYSISGNNSDSFDDYNDVIVWIMWSEGREFGAEFVQ